MTDINVVITDAKTGEELDKFSVHKGNSSTRKILVDKVRDSVNIHSELLLDHFVHIAQEERSWETISPFVARIEVPGGWIYSGKTEYSSWTFVPDPDYHANNIAWLMESINNIGGDV